MNKQHGYQPPPPGFVAPPPYEVHMHQAPPQPQPQRPVVIIQGVSYGPESQLVTCPNCNSVVATRVESETTSKTHCFAFLLCIFQCWLFAWVPYCCDSCKDKNHYCPHCNVFLGVYQH